MSPFEQLRQWLRTARDNWTLPLDKPVVQQLLTERDELLAACKQFMAWLESGELVRDIARDGDPDFAARILPFVQALNAAQAAITKAEARS